MDDKKKNDKKKEVEEIEVGAAIFIAIVVVVVLWPSIVSYLNTYFPFLNGSSINSYGSMAYDALKGFMSFLVVISIPLSLFFLIGIVYCVEKLKRIRRKEAEIFDAKVEPAIEAVGPSGNEDLSCRWEHVKTLVSSANPSDWRQAILEADIVLEDILTSLGYQGDGIGEKLKRVNPGDMKSLNEAWEAHKVRNQIAHEGSQFPLTQHEANRVVNLYKKVMEEFYFIQ
jgi:hypothetical protein